MLSADMAEHTGRAVEDVFHLRNLNIYHIISAESTYGEADYNEC